MSDAAQTPSREEEMLARLAEMDLAAAEKTHARLMAAEEPAEIADLGLAYQRLSRCVRQTLALKARLGREREIHRLRTSPILPNRPGGPGAAPLTAQVRAHLEAAAREVLAFTERETEAERYDHVGELEIYEILEDLARDPEFLDMSVPELRDLVLEIFDHDREADEIDEAPGPAPEPALQDSA